MKGKSALVIVDLQEDFLPDDGSLAVAEGRTLVPLINGLLDTEKYCWSAVIATQDWHPKDHCSFASQHNVAPYSEKEFKHPLGEKDSNGEIKTQKQVVWPDHCIQNSFGSKLDLQFEAAFKQLDQKIPSTIVKKGYLKDREYYSCFEDCWKLHKTEMEDFLLNLGITDVVFVGIAYDFCVLNSALDCAKAGFNTFVIKDCCKSVFPDKELATDKIYATGNVKIISTKDLSFN
mmetsp:Transcript_6121/g.7517  ORF Transcript_6121/g.7517 Transcript_6121/m.7517 type:complete len:232 (+) Transcript_6121:84-779(+)